MTRSKNMQDAMDCLKELIKNPNKSAEQKRKAKERLKELKRNY